MLLLLEIADCASSESPLLVYGCLLQVRAPLLSNNAGLRCIPRKLVYIVS